MEDIFVALNSILSHKMRSMLTMLGIIIGIGAIIAIFSIIEGNTENTKRQLIGGNNNTIKVVYDKKKRHRSDHSREISSSEAFLYSLYGRGCAE